VRVVANDLKIKELSCLVISLSGRVLNVSLAIYKAAKKESAHARFVIDFLALTYIIIEFLTFILLLTSLLVPILLLTSSLSLTLLSTSYQQ
jgi:hypothetical protein